MHYQCWGGMGTLTVRRIILANTRAQALGTESINMRRTVTVEQSVTGTAVRCTCSRSSAEIKR